MATECDGNMATEWAPQNTTYGSELLTCTADGHHDDAWRHDCAAWKWSMSDVGDAVYIRVCESEYPHDDTPTTTDVIVPIRLILDAAAAYAKGMK